jgi:hypothetical protein
MEEPIVTFGSESLILEMFPESIQKPLPLPEPEPIPDTIIKISSEPEKKSWCVLS